LGELISKELEHSTEALWKPHSLFPRTHVPATVTTAVRASLSPEVHSHRSEPAIVRENRAQPLRRDIITTALHITPTSSVVPSTSIYRVRPQR
jgi:hypothetical protein